MEDRLREHLERPRCAGRLPAPDASGRVTNPACGDVLELDLSVEADRIVAVGQSVLGCPASRAVASLVAEGLVGVEVAAARRLDWEAIDRAAGGLPRQKRHAAHLVADGLAAALAGLGRP